MDDIEQLIEQLQAIAQIGKHYSKDVFDRERYDQLESVAKNLTFPHNNLFYNLISGVLFCGTL